MYCKFVVLWSVAVYSLLLEPLPEVSCTSISLRISFCIPVVSVQWRRLPTTNDPPAARAYHTLTCIGSRYLLFGGFDGKSTYGDLWWLVPEGNPVLFSNLDW